MTLSPTCQVSPAGTVASLLYHQVRLQNFTPETDWIDAALGELGEELGRDL